jgi:hypothetical protein
MLKQQDVREPRPKCDICSSELTYAEYLLCDGKCIFHAENLSKCENLSKMAYIRLILGDIDIMRAKLKMKARGLSEIDYEASVSSVKPSLRFADTTGDMKRIIEAMRGHTGIWKKI